jgi:hypothetical protein
MKATLFISICLLFFSCINKEKQKEEEIKKSVSQNLNDEFFKRNLSLNIIEVRINRIETKTMDSIIVTTLGNIGAEKMLEFKKNNPEYYNDENYLKKFNSFYTSDPKWIKLKKIQKQYSSLDDGMYVYCYVKATYTDNRNGKSENFIWDSVFFVLDPNFKVLDSGLRYIFKD